MPTGQEIRRRLHSGETIIGTLVTNTSPQWVPVVKSLGIDVVFIDTEHIPIDRETLGWMCRAYSGLGIVPLVRVPSADYNSICQVLDGGACGVVAPYCETVEQVKALVGSAKLRPIKGALLQRVLAGEEQLSAEAAAFCAEKNRDVFLCINIESVQAIENLDDIVLVDGVDCLLVGPHDLSCSLGVPEQWESPVFLGAIETIITKARKAGIGAGVHYSFAHATKYQAMCVHDGLPPRVWWPCHTRALFACAETSELSCRRA
jgi:2-keto-3-deoxy-L-rhamnonate aldolase RhmA